MNPVVKNCLLLARNAGWSSMLFLGVICSVVPPGVAQPPPANAVNTDARPPTNTIVANITIGSDPMAAVVSPDSSKVYVASGLPNTVSVIDTSTNTVSAVIPLGSSPGGLALTPDGTTLYVSAGTPSGGTVLVIDTSTNAITTTVKVGDAPQQLAASPDGKAIYVPCSSDIEIISTASNQVTATVRAPGQAEPTQVLFDRDGTDAYVVCQVTQLRNGELGAFANQYQFVKSGGVSVE